MSEPPEGEDDKIPKEKRRVRCGEVDEEEYERQERKFRRKRLILLGSGLFLATICGLVAWDYYLWDTDPMEAYNKISTAANAKDWGTVFDRIDKDGQDEMIASMGWEKKEKDKATLLKDKSGRELFIAVMGYPNHHVPARLFQGKAEEVLRLDGRIAELKVTFPNGYVGVVPMIKQGSTWRINIAGLRGLKSPETLVPHSK